MKRKSVVVIVMVMIVSIGTLSIWIVRSNGAKPAQTSEVVEPARYSVVVSRKNNRPVGTASPLTFFVKDESGVPLKRFQPTRQSTLHLAVVSTDLASYEHRHPTLESSTGKFTVPDLTLPSDGTYRLYATFTAQSEQNRQGKAAPTTLLTEISAGDPAKYAPQPINEDVFASSANDLTATTFFAGNDGGGSSYYAGTESRIPFSIDQNNEPYTNLEPTHGSLGYVTAISEDGSTYLDAYAEKSELPEQTGLLQFSMNFPKPGKYKLFLNTQVDGKPTVFDHTMTIEKIAEQ